MKNYKTIPIIICSLISCYIIGCTISWEFNPLSWDAELQKAMRVLLISSIITFLVLRKIDK